MRFEPASLVPQRGMHARVPNVEFERPTCEKCGWVGEPVPVLADPQAYADDETPVPEKEGAAPKGACGIPTVPVRELVKPSRPR